jgi:CRP-like cAMP-binding protein
MPENVLVDNDLISSLPRSDRKRLLDVCEPVSLTLSDVLCEPDDALRHVYFPTGAYISLVTLLEGHAGLEVGMVGSEGMVGTELALGVARVPLRAVVQGPGTAHRIEAKDFRRVLASSPPLQAKLARYVYVVMSQRATSAACLRFHEIGPRLARWLLMSHDRAHCDSFHMTQEFLAYMLGVRRVGITIAAGTLQRAGLIEYSRGALTVLDRTGLERASCTCYGSDLRAYAQQLKSASVEPPASLSSVEPA